MIKCAISRNLKGDPMIKITQDAPNLTIDCYTQDLNLLFGLSDTNLVLLTEKEYIKLGGK